MGKFKVICKVCGKGVKQIELNHLKTHNLSRQDYIKRYPNSEWISEVTRGKRSRSISGEKNSSKRPDVRKKISNKLKGRKITWDNTSGFRDYQKKYGNPMKGKKRPEVSERMRENNPMSNPITRTKVSKTRKRLISEGKIKITGGGKPKKKFKFLDDSSYVVCMVCKKKFRQITEKHLLAHNISYTEYKEMYPNEKLISDETYRLLSRNWEERCGKKRADEIKNKISRGGIGRVHSQETKIKIGLGNTGKARTPEMKKKLSDFRKGKSWEELYGVEKAKKTKMKMSKAGKERKHTEETKKKIGDKHRGMKRPPGTGRKITKALTKESVFTMCPTCGNVVRITKSSVLKIMSNKSIGIFCSHECFYSYIKGRKFSEDEKVNFYKTHWLNPVYLDSYRRGRDAKPNKLEMRFQSVLDRYFPDKFKYVGDFRFWIVGKNPDFLDFENKKIIELFGDYWHKDDDPQEWIDHYKKYGYDCLVLWENEVYEGDNIIDRIRRLYNG